MHVDVPASLFRLQQARGLRKPVPQEVEAYVSCTVPNNLPTVCSRRTTIFTDMLVRFGSIDRADN